MLGEVDGRERRSLLEKGPLWAATPSRLHPILLRIGSDAKGIEAIFLDLRDKSYVEHTLQLLEELFLILFLFYFPLVPSPPSRFSTSLAHPLLCVSVPVRVYILQRDC